MHRIEIPQKNIVREFAEKWEELTPDEAIYAGRLLYYVYIKELPVDSFKKLMVDRLVGRKNKMVKPDITKVDNLPMYDEQAEGIENYWINEGRLLETMNFFFDEQVQEKSKKGKDTSKEEIEEDQEIQYNLNPGFVVNLVADMKIKGRKFYGPADMLVDITFIEFKNAFTACGKFSETGDPEYLFRVLSMLYRPAKRNIWWLKLTGKYNGVRKRTYDQYHTEIMHEWLLKHKDKYIGQAFYAFLFFMSVVNYIYSEPVEIDGVEYSFNALLSGGDEDKKQNMGMTGVLLAIAESSIFGDIDKTAQANYFDVMASLYRGYLINQEIKKKK